LHSPNGSNGAAAVAARFAACFAVRAAAAAALLLAACATTLPDFPERPPLGPLGADAPAASVAPDHLTRIYLSAANRRELGDKVSDLIERRFYDPFLNGIDWSQRRAILVPQVEAAGSDQAIYVVLKQIAAAVHDSHTLVLTPREAADARDFIALRTGAVLVPVEEGIAVREVEPGSPAERGGVRAGDVVQAIDGQPLDAAFFAEPPLPDPIDVRPRPVDPVDALRWDHMRAVAALLHRLPDAPAAPRTLTLAGADGETRTAVVTAERTVRMPRVTSGRFDDGIAWVRIDRFLPQLRTEITRALDAAQTAPALILDLRGNGGGSFDLYRTIAGRLMPERQLALYLLRRRSAAAKQTTVAELRLGGGLETIGQPLAILVDSHTASAAELTALTLAEDRGAILVGESTCGCAVGVQTEFVLPDGGALRIAEIGFRSPHGRRIEGDPIAPQIHAAPNLADLRAGRDAVTEAALRALRGRLTAGSSLAIVAAPLTDGQR